MEMNGFWNEFGEMMRNGGWLGVIVIALYVIETVLLVKTKVFDPRYSRVEDAKSRGHMIGASRVSGGFNVDESSSGHRRDVPHGTYEYFVDGKRYEFHHVFKSMDSRTAPTMVTLYYLDNPKKVFMEDRYSPKRILFHLIPWGVPMLLCYFLHYVPQ